MSAEIQRVKEVPKILPRRRSGHKGEYGRTLIVGGSRGMMGAVALASNAAFRGGAGLVAFAAPETVQMTIAILCPCATSIPLACDEDGQFTAQAVGQFVQAASGQDAIGVGPGMGVGVPQQMMVQAALEQTKPLVLDADGLNNLTLMENWAAKRKCPLVLTPHPGEFARLTGKTIDQVQADREQLTIDAVCQWTDASDCPNLPIACVLKGAGSVVTNGRRVYVNETGNPGMATGGCGDVLTGLVAALMGQGIEPFDAARIAVYAHGLAGDLAAEQLCEQSLMASDLLDFLPAALRNAVG